MTVARDVLTLTTEGVLLGSLSLGLARGGLSRLASTGIVAAFAAFDLSLENRSFLLDLAKAVLDGVVGGVEVESHLPIVDLSKV